MGEIRAFIAVELPDKTRNALSDILGKLRPGREKAVKWVDPNSVHLTLKFLGNIQESMVVDIIRIITDASSQAEPFNLELKELGAFPNLKAPRVVWVGVGGDVPIVITLQKKIDKSLAPLGFTPEKRAFSPHLTLGRVRAKTVFQERSELGEKVASIHIPKSEPFTVQEISLIQSTLTSSGAIYNQIATVALDKN